VNNRFARSGTIGPLAFAPPGAFGGPAPMHPSWAVDKTPSTWNKARHFAAISHAIAPDFPHCCNGKEVWEIPGQGSG